MEGYLGQNTRNALYCSRSEGDVCMGESTDAPNINNSINLMGGETTVILLVCIFLSAVSVASLCHTFVRVVIPGGSTHYPLPVQNICFWSNHRAMPFHRNRTSDIFLPLSSLAEIVRSSSVFFPMPEPATALD